MSVSISPVRAISGQEFRVGLSNLNSTIIREVHHANGTRIELIKALAGYSYLIPLVDWNASMLSLLRQLSKLNSTGVIGSYNQTTFDTLVGQAYNASLLGVRAQEDVADYWDYMNRTGGALFSNNIVTSYMSELGQQTGNIQGELLTLSFFIDALTIQHPNQPVATDTLTPSTLALALLAIAVAYGVKRTRLRPLTRTPARPLVGDFR